MASINNQTFQTQARFRTNRLYTIADHCMRDVVGTRQRTLGRYIPIYTHSRSHCTTSIPELYRANGHQGAGPLVATRSGSTRSIAP